jgi:integrase
MPAIPELLLDRDVIEAYVVVGCATLATSTKATYRSVLYRLAEVVGPRGPRGVPLSGAPAARPYAEAERRALRAIALAQRDEQRRASAMAMLCLGVGAGLRPGELVALRGGEIVNNGDAVVVGVSGGHRRRVPVASRYARELWVIARRAGAGPVFRPGPARRDYKNFVGDFARDLVADPAAPRLSMRRGRASFVCDHLAASTPLSVVLDIAGIAEVESLARYARWAGVPHTKAALRARARDEQRQ